MRITLNRNRRLSSTTAYSQVLMHGQLDRCFNYNGFKNIQDDIPLGMIVPLLKEPGIFNKLIMTGIGDERNSFIEVCKNNAVLESAMGWGDPTSRFWYADPETGAAVERVFTDEECIEMENVTTIRNFFLQSDENAPDILPYVPPLSSGYGNTGQYKNLYDDVKSISRPVINRFRNYSCMSFGGMVSLVPHGYGNNNEDYELDPLFMISVKPESVRYVVECMLLDESPHPDVFTLWVKNSFDHKDFAHKGLRSNFRKHVLRPAKADGITVRHIDKIELTQPTESPSKGIRIPSLKKKAIKASFIELFNVLKLEKDMKNSNNIDLVW